MRNRPALTASDTEKMVAASRAEAAKNKWNVSIAVVEIHGAMRTTFAARECTDEPLPDDVLFDILDRARFAPSGGNRQGWHVIVVRDRATREALAALATPAAKRYTTQREAGENPWNPVDPTSVDAATAERTPPMRRLIEPVLKAAVVLVVCVDLKVVACLDQ